MGHPTKECWTLKKIFNDRIHSGELVIENNDVRNNPLPAHNSQRGTANVVTHNFGTDKELMPQTEAQVGKETSVEDDQSTCPTVAAALMKTANFRKFFDLLGFDEEARLAAATALTQISERQYEECSAMQRSLCEGWRTHMKMLYFLQTQICA